VPGPDPPGMREAAVAGRHSVGGAATGWATDVSAGHCGKHVVRLGPREWEHRLRHTGNLRGGAQAVPAGALGPARRSRSPHRVAGHEAAWITGQTINTEGGFRR